MYHATAVCYAKRSSTNVIRLWSQHNKVTAAWPRMSDAVICLGSSKKLVTVAGSLCESLCCGAENRYRRIT